MGQFCYNSLIRLVSELSFFEGCMPTYQQEHLKRRLKILSRIYGRAPEVDQEGVGRQDLILDGCTYKIKNQFELHCIILKILNTSSIS